MYLSEYQYRFTITPVKNVLQAEDLLEHLKKNQCNMCVYAYTYTHTEQEFF
jgi:hypothetical protein